MPRGLNAAAHLFGCMELSPCLTRDRVVLWSAAKWMGDGFFRYNGIKICQEGECAISGEETDGFGITAIAWEPSPPV